MSLSPDLVGRSLGRYELVRRLATGGMAEIYLARIAGPARFEKQLVVKRMLPHLARDPQYVDMFLSEARVAARLDHPNIVRVEELGEDELDYYYAMEYVRGADLLQVMKVLSRNGRTIPIECAVAIGIALCSALAFAHDQTDAEGRPLNIVHRDVSLPNVLLSYEGAVKLADFGVAQVDDRRRTRTGVLKGKLGYMSPEQCRGEPLDRRSDLFALGIVLYEITTGERLFGGADTDFAVMERIVRGEVTPPTDLVSDYPIELGAILMTALQRDRNARYQNALEMQRDLEAFLRVHRMAGSASVIAELVRRTFPIGSRRPSQRTLPDPREPSELEIEQPVASRLELELAAVADARSSDQLVPAQAARSIADAQVPPPERPSFEALSPPVPDLRHRSYVPVLVVMSLVVAGIGVSAWAAWRNMYAPGELSEVVATERTTPEITISSTRWSESPKASKPAAAPSRTTREIVRKAPAPEVPPTRTASRASDVVAPAVARTKPRPPPQPRPTLRPRSAANPPEDQDTRIEDDDPVRTDEKPAEIAAVAARGAGLFPRTQELPATPPAGSRPPAAPSITATPARPAPVVRAGSLDATPTIANLDVRGPLTDSVVRQGLERTLASLRACYRAAARARGATPSASVQLAFEIGETRTATKIRASGGAGLDGLAACAGDAANQIRTRLAPDVGNARVVVTIAFRPL